MAKSLEHTNLENREARNRLAPRHQPYWHLLDQDCCVGYFKGTETGIWIARFVRRNGEHIDQRLGLADDFTIADGVQAMDFNQAKMVTRNWYAEQAIKEAGMPIDDSPFNTAGPACGRI